MFVVKLEIDSTDDRTNRTNTNELDNRLKKANVRGAAADGNDHMRVDTEEIREELKYTLLETNSVPGLRKPYAVAVIGAALLLSAVNVRV